MNVLLNHQDCYNGNPMWPEVELAGFHFGENKKNDYAVFTNIYYAIGHAFGSNFCKYVNGRLNSEVRDEPAGYVPFEWRAPFVID